MSLSQNWSQIVFMVTTKLHNLHPAAALVAMRAKSGVSAVAFEAT